MAVLMDIITSLSTVSGLKMIITRDHIPEVHVIDNTSNSMHAKFANSFRRKRASNLQ